MTYVVTENCIQCKYTDCVDVCPVDCFVEGPNFLAINPDECIDCTLCVAECPAEAISPESADLVEWVEINRKYAKEWPVITKQKAALPEAKEFDGVKDKFKNFFDPRPPQK